MEFKPYQSQLDAVDRLKVGKILYGDVGSGKTITSLLFYKKWYSDYPLIVITTAKKRDTGDWQAEAKMIGVHIQKVDSWNNIDKYTKERNTFFIFDEQRVIGWGKWTKSFLKITVRNKWVLLTGTPANNWMDYAPVFVANGFYKNKTEFINEHVEYSRFTKYPSILRYHNIRRLERNRSNILVRMTVERHTKRHRHYVECKYDTALYSQIVQTRFDPFKEKPIETASGLTSLLRWVVATSEDRIHEACWQIYKNKRTIVFYNYNYERDILEDLCEFIGRPYGAWNGRTHLDVPDTEEWVYLVQYTAGAEGWNCKDTDTIIFYSPNYSWKVNEQSEGRIDRLNTKFVDLNYIYLYSKSSIDTAVFRAITNGRKFNASAWVKKGVL